MESDKTRFGGIMPVRDRRQLQSEGIDQESVRHGPAGSATLLGNFLPLPVMDEQVREKSVRQHRAIFDMTDG